MRNQGKNLTKKSKWKTRKKYETLLTHQIIKPQRQKREKLKYREFIQKAEGNNSKTIEYFSSNKPHYKV